jgi:hypothetical protein
LDEFILLEGISEESLNELEKEFPDDIDLDSITSSPTSNVLCASDIPRYRAPFQNKSSNEGLLVRSPSFESMPIGAILEDRVTRPLFPPQLGDGIGLGLDLAGMPGSSETDQSLHGMTSLSNVTISRPRTPLLKNMPSSRGQRVNIKLIDNPREMIWVLQTTWVMSSAELRLRQDSIHKKWRVKISSCLRTSVSISTHTPML